MNSKILHSIKADKFFYIFNLVCIFLILTLPILSVPPTFHPPAWIKSIVFRSIFSITLLVFFCRLILTDYRKSLVPAFKNLLDKKSRIFYPFWFLIAFLALTVLATIFSLEPFFSLWGSPMRGGGAVNLVMLILFSIFTFITVRREDWKKLLVFSIFIGGLVALLGVLQKFDPFPNFLVGYSDRPVSTIGGSTFLALYVVIPIFLALSFLIREKSVIKKILYFLAIALFLACVTVTATRSAIAGIGAGALFFILFFPQYGRNIKKIKTLKIALVLVLVATALAIVGLYYSPSLVQKLENNRLFGTAFLRVWNITQQSPLETLTASRGSGWSLGLKALKDRPLFGYGPENFSIAFDKYYDPNLPGIRNASSRFDESTGWWDKSHNFLLEIADTEGIPAFIVFLLFLIFIFWQLQVYKSEKAPSFGSKSLGDIIVAHGLQATFLAYFVTNFFNFDVFSSYLLFFLLVSYSFSLIQENDPNKYVNTNISAPVQKRDSNPAFKYTLVSVLFLITIIFLWNYNLRLIPINRGINIVNLWVGQDTAESCTNAIKLADKLYSSTNSILDNYLQLSYLDAITFCSDKLPANQQYNLAMKGAELMSKTVVARPYYTRAWLYEAAYLYKGMLKNPDLDKNERIKFLQVADLSIKKAYELSPMRQEIFSAWIKIDVELEKYKEADELADKCLTIDPIYLDCLLSKALVYTVQGKIDEAMEFIKMGFGYKDYGANSKPTISQLINSVGILVKQDPKKNYYEVLAVLYQRLIALDDPKNYQNHATLAYIYSTLGQYDKAREEAAIVLKLSPESKETVNAFLESLPK